MSNPIYRTLPGGTQVVEYGEKMVIYCKGSGVAPPQRSKYINPPPSCTQPTPPPPSPRELLREQLGLDTIGKSSGKIVKI